MNKAMNNFVIVGAFQTHSINMVTFNCLCDFFMLFFAEIWSVY